MKNLDPPPPPPPHFNDGKMARFALRANSSLILVGGGGGGGGEGLIFHFNLSKIIGNRRRLRLGRLPFSGWRCIKG